LSTASPATDISPLSLHDALPICGTAVMLLGRARDLHHGSFRRQIPLEDHEAAGGLYRPIQRPDDLLSRRLDRLGRLFADRPAGEDRKSTRLNSSHVKISYAVFCL